MIVVNEIDFHGMQAYQVINDKIDFIILPELGGKIISYKYNGHELFYYAKNIEKIRDEFKNIEEIKDIKSFRKKYSYDHPIGGFKNWIAPQAIWTWPPYIDLEFGKYAINIDNDGEYAKIEVISPICRESKIQFKRIISLPASYKSINIKQQMINCGQETKNLGVWDVTQVVDHGKVIFAVPNKETDIVEMVKHYKDIEYISCDNVEYAVIECRNKTEFKIGTRSSHNWVLTLKEIGNFLYGYLKIFDKFSGDSKFGHECVVEVYDSEKYNYFEVEVHSPVKEILPGKSISLNEVWLVYQWDIKTELSDIVKDLSEINM